MLKVRIEDIDIFTLEEKGAQTFLNDKPVHFQVMERSEQHIILTKDNQLHKVALVDYSENHLTLSINGKKCKVDRIDPISDTLMKLGMNASSQKKSIKEIKAPMPGSILGLSVSEKDQVKKGDPLLVLEAMKMENVIQAPGDGTIRKILVGEKESVEKGQVLITFD